MAQRFKALGARSASQYTSEADVLAALRPLYAALGRDPEAIVAVTTSAGGWLNALRFCVHRADTATTWVTRKDLDRHYRHGLVKALRAFSVEHKAGCDLRNRTQEHPAQLEGSAPNAARIRRETPSEESRIKITTILGHRWIWQHLAPDGHVLEESEPFAKREDCEAAALAKGLSWPNAKRRRRPPDSK